MLEAVRGPTCAVVVVWWSLLFASSLFCAIAVAAGVGVAVATLVAAVAAFAVVSVVMC